MFLETLPAPAMRIISFYFGTSMVTWPMTVKPGRVWLGGTASPIWDRVVCCWCFCASHRLAKTNTMFKHKGVHEHIWYVGCRSMNDFVVISSDLRPYVLDTWVKNIAELSTITTWSWVGSDGGERCQTDLVSTNELCRCTGNVWQRPLSKRPLNHTFGTASPASQVRLRTSSSNGPCSGPP